ncbi:MAG: hypothetical protein P1U89_26495 [Verrucomicrobiales bacterium]|nr:hypothetical protein [Verrucomicrobiales bacterium]
MNWKSLNRDLKSSRLIYLKGFLFLIIGTVSALTLLVESFSLRTGVLIIFTIWGFCRFYYFMFYVVQNYVDPNYRFSGIGSFLSYLLTKKK